MTLGDILALLFGKKVPLPPGIIQAPPSVKDVFDGINKLRINRGESALVWMGDLSKISQVFSDLMAQSDNLLDHAGFSARVPARARGAAENSLDNRSTDSKVIVQQWRDSAKHYKNIIGDYNQVGVSVSISKSGLYYWNTLFIKV